MKKILFPTDFSEVSHNAFVHALHLAQLVDGELLLLHTFELPVIDNQFTPDNYYLLFESLQLSQSELLNNEIQKMRAIAEQYNLAHIKIAPRLAHGDLTHTIKKSVQEEAITFIVMGSSGTSGWEKFLLGSNTEAVQNEISVPVLSIPLEAKYNKIKTIGFTTRYREKDKKALRIVLEIAAKMKADIKCLYVKTSDSDVSVATIKEWEVEFANESVLFSVIASEDVEETILNFIAHESIDMLSMLTYKRNFFSALFNPSLTHQCAIHSPVPILALHENEIA